MDHKVELLNVQWVDDVLQRKSYADFLTNYLVSKMQGQTSLSKWSFKCSPFLMVSGYL